MSDFLYKARDNEGNLVQGTITAENQSEIIDVLQRRKLFVTSIQEILLNKGKELTSFNFKKGISFSRRVKNDDLCIFARQLSTLLGAGVPLLRSLNVLSAQISSIPLREAVDKLHIDIQGGSTLRDALERHPKIFSSFWVNLVGTGEASGQLSSVLMQIAQYFEQSGSLQRKVINAMIYPAVLLGVCIFAVGVFMFKIFPQFTKMFATFNAELPAFTQTIINISDFIRRFFFLMFLASGVLIFLFKAFFRTEKGKLLRDSFFLKLPVLGDLFRQIAISNFSRGLGAMIASGVPILYALDIVTNTIGNKVIENALKMVKDSVREGKSIAEPLEKSGVFPSMVILMVNVGEETGELSDMLKHVSEFYEERITGLVDRLSSLIEPFILLFMGGIIGVLVIAMFLPIFKLATAIRL
ncbi:MAG: type II secretion system F family protein [Candidatus Omnitrophota bacterium]|nr:MAG: type II secretion system F family protein [Candidatus Omnitrophota bacterium]